MQTFLPSTSFEQSAKWLDNQRLGKQRVEVLQILKALTEPDYGWKNHPAVKMWKGYEVKLIQYGLVVCNEWIARGYNDTCYNKIENIKLSDKQWLVYYENPYNKHPGWLTEEFASNHRSILLGKAYENRLLALDEFYNAAERKRKSMAETKYLKCDAVLEWYIQFNWSEQPAQKVDGKWPYIWPVK